MMTETQPRKTGSEICSIRIMFPVKSDEAAIEYKKKIAAILADIPDAQIQFSIMSAAPMPGMMGR